jgi:hypothetical protein
MVLTQDLVFIYDFFNDGGSNSEYAGSRISLMLAVMKLRVLQPGSQLRDAPY